MNSTDEHELPRIDLRPFVLVRARSCPVVLNWFQRSERVQQDYRMLPDLLEAPRVHSIVGAFYAVYKYFGYGLLESAYAGAFEYELADRGHEVARELGVEVRYKGRHVTWQRLDLVVDRKVVLEVKATERLSPSAQRQLVSYLRATPFEVGLLLHFGLEPKFYRFIDFPKK